MNALAADQLPGRGRRLRLPRRSIRLRLTVLYGSLFLLSGIALLGITYLLVGREYHSGLFTKAVSGPGSFIVSSQISGSSAQPAPTLRSGSASGAAFGTITIKRAGQPLITLPLPGAIVQGTPTQELISAQAETQSHAALGALFAQSGVALTIMALISVWLGWLVAGRVLRPLRTITEAAHEISAHDLHRRLDLDGPDDEFRRLGKTFDGLLERLEGSFEAQRRFVANASHELRTPLTLQRALVQVALADPNADLAALREMGAEVLATGERQEQLIEALLTLSQSQSGVDRHEPIDLAALAAAAVRPLGEGGLTVESSLEQARTTGDPDLVERLLANLVGNAVEHNLPGGRIEVATCTSAGRAILTVANTGPEIPAAEIGRLFQPFQRLQGERTSSGTGVGLGLSIVEAIAVAHSATLSARPRAGGGLEVEIGFPAEAAVPRLTALPSTALRNAAPAALTALLPIVAVSGRSEWRPAAAAAEGGEAPGGSAAASCPPCTICERDRQRTKG